MKEHHEKRTRHSIILAVMLFFFAAATFAAGVPEEARRYMIRGTAAIEMAKTPADYALALQEFEQAVKLAPDYADAWFNLGNVQSKLGDYTSAIKSFQRYLELAPKAPDAAKVREDIYKLEYRRDRRHLAATLSGTWSAQNKQTFKLAIDGAQIQLKRDEQQGDDIITIKSMGTHTGPMTDVPLIFVGFLLGDRISGQYIQPGGKYSGYCELPERKGSFEGTVDAAAGRMRIVYNRLVLEHELKFKSFLSAEMVCTQTNRREEAGYVLELTRKQ